MTQKEDTSESEKARLRLILEATLEGWWEWDLTSNKAYHSSGWFRMLGYSDDQMQMCSSVDTWLNLIHPDDVARVLGQQATYMVNGDTWETEFRMRTAEGNYVWIQSRGKVVRRNETGEPMLAVGVHVDITEHKQLEELREEQRIRTELLRGIIRVSLSSLNVYDFISKRLAYSAGLVFEKLGYQEEEFLALTANFFEQVLHPDDQEKITRHLLQIRHSKPNQVFENVIRLRDKQNTYHSILIKDSVLVRSETGEIVQVIGSAMDITEYVNLKKRLDEYLQFLEELSFKNSHAVRGPVATIMGLINLIKLENPSTTSLLELINYLDRTVNKLDQIITEFGEAVHHKTDTQSP